MSIIQEETVPVIDACTVKFSSKLNKKCPAFVTEFSNGQLRPDYRGEAKFECYRRSGDSDPSKTRDAKRSLVYKGDRLTYSGTSQELSPGIPLRYFIGVRDKSNGRMKLYDSVFFHMKPVFNVTLKNPDLDQSKSYREGISDLTSSFGSKSRQRAMNSRRKYEVQDPVVDKSLLDDTPASPQTLGASSLNTSQSMEYLPPHDRMASSVEEVFNIHDIISMEEDYALGKEAEELLNLSRVEMQELNGKFCKYVTHRLETGVVSSTKAKYLIYFNYLIAFHQLVYKDIQKKDPAPNIPEPFKQKILSTFTMTSRQESGRSCRSLPPVMKDKLVSYILVLSLFIDDFNINISSVHGDLKKVSLVKLVTIFHSLGCHVNSHKVQNQVLKFAILKLPLYVMMPKYVKKV